MSERAIAKTSATADGSQHSGGRQADGRLRMRKARSGAFIVQDEANRRGGCFLTYKAALKFIREEFGPDAQIITTQLTQKEAA